MNFLSLLLGKQYNVLTYLPEAVLVIDETGKIFYANKKAFKLFKEAGLVDVMLKIAKMYEIGGRCIINHRESVKWLEKEMN